MNPELLEQVQRALNGARRILVTTHISPDGDAIGSLTAVGLALQQLGRQPLLVCDDAVDRELTFLPLTGEIKKRIRPDAKLDLIIAVDCGDAERMGRTYARLREPKPPLINIDHHISNTFFGTVNVVDPDATSTAEILTDLLPRLGVELTPEIATSLLTGVVTDTQAFRIPTVTAHTLDVASRLVAAGADLADITQRTMVIKPLGTVLAWRAGLNNLRIKGRIAWTTLSWDEQQAISKSGLSSGGLNNLLAEIEEVEVGIVFTEKENGRVKVGFRSRPPVDVATIATELGGGGHPNAAGALLDGPLEEAARRVVDLMQHSLAGQPP